MPAGAVVAVALLMSSLTLMAEGVGVFEGDKDVVIGLKTVLKYTTNNNGTRRRMRGGARHWRLEAGLMGKGS